MFRPLSQHLERFNADHPVPQDDASRADTARLYIAELQRFVTEHEALLRAMMLAGGPAGDSGNPIESLAAYFEQGAAVQSARIEGTPRVDPRLMVRAAFAAVLANRLFRDWLYPAGLADDASIDAAIADFVLDGINANRG